MDALYWMPCIPDPRRLVIGLGALIPV